MNPSSSTAGFFQSNPTVLSAYHDDFAFRRVLVFYLPSPLPSEVRNDIERFADLVLAPQTLEWTADAENNPPVLRPLTTFGTPETGKRVLGTSEGWRRLQDLGIQEGIVGLGYPSGGAPKGVNRRVYQFLKYHIWSPSAAMVTCPSAMTDGAAVLLGRHKHENPEILGEAVKKLISRTPGYAWTSGQWMTERKGGSDVSGTETAAVLTPDAESGNDADGMPLGPWRIDGFKWFSSATDANATVLLAQTQNGLSAFYAPLWRQRKDRKGVELNGIRIQRLKNKLGTKAVPTAELELKGLNAYLLGQEGMGVKEISTILTITRIHNAVGVMGQWGRGLAVSRAFSRVRKVAGGKLLLDVKPHMRGLAQEHVRYAAQMHLTFFVAALLGFVESTDDPSSVAGACPAIPKEKEDAELLLRLLTPVMKAQTALAGIAGLRFSMESLGGVGYLENEDPVLNIARIYRDANVTSIWEGTTDVMADDLVRVLKGPNALQILEVVQWWVSAATTSTRESYLEDLKTALREDFHKWAIKVARTSKEELKWMGRDLLKELDYFICACLLFLDAASDGNAIADEISRRWYWSNKAGLERLSGWEEEAAWDSRIVTGQEHPTTSRL